MSILVIAEHHHSSLADATLAAVKAAQDIGGDITVLVGGENAGDAATEASKINDVKKVLHADGASLSHCLAENFAALVVGVASGYSHIVFPATTFGKNVAPRVAALLDIQQISDIIKVIDEKTFERPVYAGNAIAQVESNDAVKIITVRGSCFDNAEVGDGSAEKTTVAAPEASDLSGFVKAELSESDRPELTSAKIVVSGGRGVGSGENFTLIEKLADKLGAAVGASRAAVDAGFVPNDYQVGQTGKVVAPDLYIAVGISGAIQHLAGMKNSKVIVAINKDEEAPIFQVADYGLVADLFDAVPELSEKL